MFSNKMDLSMSSCVIWIDFTNPLTYYIHCVFIFFLLCSKDDSTTDSATILAMMIVIYNIQK